MLQLARAASIELRSGGACCAPHLIARHSLTLPPPTSPPHIQPAASSHTRLPLTGTTTPSPAPPGYSLVLQTLHHICRPELLSVFQKEEVNDEFLPYVDDDSFAALGFTQAETVKAKAFTANGYRALDDDASAATAAAADVGFIDAVTEAHAAPV